MSGEQEKRSGVTDPGDSFVAGLCEAGLAESGLTEASYIKNSFVRLGVPCCLRKR